MKSPWAQKSKLMTGGRYSEIFYDTRTGYCSCSYSKVDCKNQAVISPDKSCSTTSSSYVIFAKNVNMNSKLQNICGFFISKEVGVYLLALPLANKTCLFSTRKKFQAVNIFFLVNTCCCCCCLQQKIFTDLFS